MVLFIKNMVCDRCVMRVSSELERIGLYRTMVDLGEVNILEPASELQIESFRLALLESGLELMDNEESLLMENIKSAIMELVHYSEAPVTTSLQVYLSQQLSQDYEYLSAFFSEAHGVTLEKFFILHKMEQIKELLVYGDLTLAEIAKKMNYSNVAQLSTQFKSITGLTTSHFKQLKDIRLSIF